MDWWGVIGTVIRRALKISTSKGKASQASHESSSVNQKAALSVKKTFSLALPFNILSQCNVSAPFYAILYLGHIAASIYV